jgi:hypothetical protein
MGGFFESVRSRKRPICDVEVGHRSATLCHLAVIALRLGRPVEWDAAREDFTGDTAALARPHMARAMRAPYDYSFVA